MAAAGKAYSKQSVKKVGRERKEVLVAELTKKIDETNGLVFTDYKGITHQQLETLKRELKKDDSTILIAKNSLMKISLGNSKNYKDAKENEALVGPTATLFIKGDMVEALKKLQKAAKDGGLPKVKFGVLEGQILDETAVLKIASLPGRETLLTQFVAMLNSPIQGFVTGLNSIPQKFVMTLDAVAKAKPAGAVQNNDSAKPKVATAAQTDKPAADSAPAEEKTDESTAKDEPTEAPVSDTDESTDAASANTADEKKPTENTATETKDETEKTDKEPTNDKDEAKEGGEE